MAKDPVCGMEVKEEEASIYSEYHGNKIYFCSEPCKERFEENPDRYLEESTGA
jgi:Cu+-exporting ATPase